MESGRTVVRNLLIQGIIVAIVAGYLLEFGLTFWFRGNPGETDISFLGPFVGTGFGAAYFSITLLLHPVRTKGVKEFAPVTGGEYFK